MVIVIAGGTGFVGRPVCRLLTDAGHSVLILSRQAGKHAASATLPGRLVQWDSSTQGPWVRECEGAEAVINLSGAPIADTRWTDKRKQQLIDSRVQSTKTLLRAISTWNNKPHTYISASGIGFYGDRGEEEVTEASSPGKGFLPELCQIWESTAMEGEALGLRVVPIRFGMVLGRNGGALGKMSLPFKLFLGGPILPGTQYISWIHREDLARLILFVITHRTVIGPVNGVAPESVTMREFCSTLGEAMHRPSWFPVPKIVLETALGELASMLTTGQRVSPQKALKGGFTFTYPTLHTALQSIFGPTSSKSP